MSSPTVALQPKKEFNWKRLFIKAAGFGAGATLVFCLMAGVSIWYMNRSKPLKPWNTKAITAEYYGVTSGDQKDTLDFAFVLGNNTEQDYKLGEYSPASVAAFLEDTNSLTSIDKDTVKVEFPIFIPAHQKTRIRVTTPSYGFSEQRPASDGERAAYYDRVAAHVSKEMSNLSGFRIFDDSNRYEIILSGGWKERAAKAKLTVNPTDISAGLVPNATSGKK